MLQGMPPSYYTGCTDAGCLHPECKIARADGMPTQGAPVVWEGTASFIWLFPQPIQRDCEKRWNRWQASEKKRQRNLKIKAGGNNNHTE
jgi:hypothetical protein